MESRRYRDWAAAIQPNRTKIASVQRGFIIPGFIIVVLQGVSYHGACGYRLQNAGEVYCKVLNMPTQRGIDVSANIVSSYY